jgi:hypothetical protein
MASDGNDKYNPLPVYIVLFVLIVLGLILAVFIYMSKENVHTACFRHSGRAVRSRNTDIDLEALPPPNYESIVEESPGREEDPNESEIWQEISPNNTRRVAKGRL